MNMKPITAKLEKIEGKYYLNIPEAIIEMMGWSEGEELLVPFYEITQKNKLSWEKELQKEFKNEIEINLRGNQKSIKRQDIIDLLENPTEDLYKFRSAYIEWNGNKFGSKAIFKKLIGHSDFNTVEAEWYLRQLGFLAKRTYYSDRT